MKLKGGVMEIILALLGGVLLGGGAVFGLTHKPKPKPDTEEIAKGQIDVQKQLTNLDITKPLCEPAYIKENGDTLCREVLCMQFTRGIDSETSGATCESISNINNKIRIEKWCNQYQDPALKQDCIDLFWKRN